MNRPAHRRLEWPALRVAGIYLVLGSLWIAFSDRAVLAMVDDPELLTRIQTWKGWFFVLASAGVIYFLTRGALAASTRLERSDRRVGLIMDTIPSRVGWRDREGRYLGCNARFARDAGLDSPERIRGLTDADLAWSINAPAIREEARRVVESGRARREREQLTTSANGEVMWVRYSIVPFSDGNGRIGGTLLCYDDITEQVQSRQQLRQAQKMQEIGQFTSGVAHDFNNVLSVIRANADLVVEGMLDEEDAHLAVEEIGSAARSASVMVGKLLGLGRRADVVVVPTDLPAVLTGLSSMFSRLLTPAYRYELEVDGTPAAALADPNTVEQAVLNLVTNARDAMEGGGRILVEVGEVILDEGAGAVRPKTEAAERFWTPPSPSPPQPGRYVSVSVTDEGPGIDPETLELIFQPFFTTKEAGSGTGLGLAMVQGLMEQQNGAVQVRTAVGRGTTMRLLLPALEGAAAGVAAAEPVSSRVRDEEAGGGARDRDGRQPEGGTILVVDDQHELRRTIGRVLRRYGWDVLEAADGIEALAVVEERGADVSLVLSDLTMPRMGGMELFRELRVRGITTPFVVTSGLSELRDVASEEEAATIPFIPKPWTPVELVGRIRDLL